MFERFNQTDCEGNVLCYWDTDHCDEKASSCYSNSSLQVQGECDTHPLCQWILSRRDANQDAMDMKI